jgi:N-acetylglucosaminyl-diphospho-decaprenol L-rhamnosyltransferase
MRLAIVLVHYHAPALAVAAVAALQADAAGAGLELELVLVDNGSDEAGRALLATLPVERIDPGENLGYAGGVNLGVARSRSDLVVVMNPDVLVLPGCLATLVAALDHAEIAGPQFYWDRGRRLLLPPAEVRTRRAEIDAVRARHHPGRAVAARRRWRRHARRHWQHQGLLATPALSGSLLALRRRAWERVGPFDPGFKLFYEETDWLLRAWRRGLRPVYVPAAEAVHLYNQSAGREPRAQAWFEESASRFRRRHYGRWFERLLHRLDDRAGRRAVPHAAPPALSTGGLTLAALPESWFPLWAEVSAGPAGYPAAAERLERPHGVWRLPEEIRAGWTGGPLTLRLCDEAGSEVAVYALPMGEAG